MARATTMKTPTRKSRSLAVDEAQKRKPGRPIGSTSSRKPTAVAKVSRPVAKRAVAAKPAARAPKLNKAELEAQVGKLERAIARLREKNRELKQAVADGREHQDTLESQLAAKPVAEAAKPARKSKRSSVKVAPDTSAEGDASEAADA